MAHVDAGKTTLSEALLFESGAITKLGRVDHQDTFFDTDFQERARGITIFSKQAEMEYGGRTFMLLEDVYKRQGQDTDIKELEMKSIRERIYEYEYKKFILSIILKSPKALERELKRLAKQLKI